ncbi:uncharacterized protein LOC116204041 [Punica granatum]|uniref:Uncharacterized protein n=2 Tax=Punica granatum TaxID=22663 RepID=A0A2I0JML2_PUNGR|nr:uncharacterized protein LOC116204041 [Punica granatum]PKI57522.1 hypothetical protein CRG98_022173 [Punica granatum]
MSCAVPNLCSDLSARSFFSLHCFRLVARGRSYANSLLGGPRGGGNNLHFRSARFFSNPLPPKRQWQRRSLVPCRSAALELPLLPFSVNEVLVPSESKTLHLYEARYLALLEDSLSRKKKLFVHFVLDPISMPGSSDGLSFAARYGCLVLIENVERLEVGALVTIRGICRIKLANFIQAEPYLTGVVLPLKDKNPEDSSDISSRVAEVKESLHKLNSLEIKLKAPKEAPLQTLTANSLMWAEKKPSLDCDEAFILPPEERVSFAAYQPVSGSSESELLKLQKEKLQAMDVRDTIRRLDDSLRLVKENISVVAAKLAIQSLEMQ